MRRVAHLLVLALVAAVLTAPAAWAVGDVSDTINIHLPASSNGPGRVALRLSRATFPTEGADQVLLATEGNFADALSSGSLQASDTPLLLTASNDVRADVGNEIDRLGAREVILLGGTAALDESVVDELADAGVNVRRLDGATRFETAVSIAELAGRSDTVLLSRAFGSSADPSQAFADSLSSGGWAAQTGWPILLTATDALPAPTRAAIEETGVDTVVVLGGPSAISDDVVVELQDLGVTVQRVFGATRFGTAVEVARQRGFADAGDADRIILAEGQAADAWAGGFASAAHSALHDAPILLANGADLPPETVAFLSDNRFAVDSDDVDGPVLVCAAEAEACDQARLLLGLPAEATVDIDEPEDGVPSRSTATGVIELSGAQADVVIFGQCVQDGLLTVEEDGTFDLPVQAAPGICPIQFEITFANGTVQRLTRPLLIAPTTPQTGPVVDTETGGDAYTLVPAGAAAPVEVAYQAGHRFVVDGQAATIGAFEAAITVADIITHTPDTPEGAAHELTNIDPATLETGTVGNVNLSAGTLAIIEPVSGIVLRPGLRLDTEAPLFLNGQPTTLEALADDINEGDTIEVTADRFSITNQTTVGPVTALSVDQVSGLIRFGIGNLGDDPANAEDDRFRIVETSMAQRLTVDGQAADFAAMAEAISTGDVMSYRRMGGVERFVLQNMPPPGTRGIVTETSNPDGSPVAPEPEDGGAVTVLTAEGRVQVRYSAQANFLLDDRLATEPEVEAALSAGDEIEFQPADAGTGTVETVHVMNRDLTGSVADIAEGDNTLDVIGLSGLVYDDLDYATGAFGGAAVHLVDGSEVTLIRFEEHLRAIDDGEVEATILVRAVAGDTEYQLTLIDP